eukprot:GILI01021901.1.p1 GENE.GILI01021901.1~~GILI01021901.1.p1  ORF type:complete len:282 (-),score=30.31 GILI01021901.1:96-893(-)
MLSYVWWALRGFQSEEGNDAGDEDEASILSETDELAAIKAEEEAMERELTTCLGGLRKALYQKRLIEEGYEELIMSTFDEDEHPIVRREVDTIGPIFQLNEGTLQRISVDVTEMSDESASDYSDTEIANALRPAVGAVAIACPPAGAPKSPRTRTVLQLENITEADFGSHSEYSLWIDYYRLNRARASLTSKATRYELLGKVEDECEKLDDRLFTLRLRLNNMKAKGRRAEHQLEVLSELTSHDATEEAFQVSQTASSDPQLSPA